MMYEDWRQQRLIELASELRMPNGGDIPNNHVEGLIDMVRAIKPRTVIEIGSYRGVSTEVFVLHAQMVYSIDPNLEDEAWEHLNKRMKGYTNIQLIRGWSPGELMRLPSVDMIYIDGLHEGVGPIIDISSACWRVNHPGFICGHDYNIPDVQVAVKQVLGVEEPKLFSDDSWAVRIV